MSRRLAPAREALARMGARVRCAVAPCRAGSLALRRWRGSALMTGSRSASDRSYMPVCCLTLGFSDGAGDANEARCGRERAGKLRGTSAMAEAQTTRQARTAATIAANRR